MAARCRSAGNGLWTAEDDGTFGVRRPKKCNIKCALEVPRLVRSIIDGWIKYCSYFSGAPILKVFVNYDSNYSCATSRLDHPILRKSALDVKTLYITITYHIMSIPSRPSRGYISTGARDFMPVKSVLTRRSMVADFPIYNKDLSR